LFYPIRYDIMRHMVERTLSIIKPDAVSRDFFFFQAEDGIRDDLVTGVQTCALPIWVGGIRSRSQQQVCALGQLLERLLHGGDVIGDVTNLRDGRAEPAHLQLDRRLKFLADRKSVV